MPDERKSYADKEWIVERDREKNGIYISTWQLIMLIVLAFGAVVAVGLLAAFFGPPFKTTKRVEIRLPDKVIPINYKIKLQPFLIPGNFTFSGNVTVEVKVFVNTSSIKLHAKDLKISSHKVQDMSRKKERNRMNSSILSIKDIAQSKEYIEINFKKPLIAGQKLEVFMEFQGNLANKLEGFYLSSYGQDGRTRWLATTQFEPASARQAFPCFDEPAFKATFEIILVRWKNMTSLSNMPLNRVVAESEDWEADVYHKTPKMSTYLVACVVSDFKVNETKKHNLAIWSRPEVVELANYSLNVTPHIRDYLETKLDIKYPLPKMDMVGIPDFSFGAMENWGLMIFRESRLLVDPAQISISELQDVVDVIAHEWAHSWFGNLVTCEWWDDLWLNEGFATYMAYRTVEHIHPEWHADLRFQTSDMQNVLQVDSLESSTPVSRAVSSHPGDIQASFAPVAYSKGAALIRMMNHFLGQKDFDSGVASYLKKFSYKNAKQDDLWQCLNEAQTGKDKVNISRILNTWTLQPGYPLITLKRNYNKKSGNLTQERFLLNASSSKDKYSKQIWEVPITYAKHGDVEVNASKLMWLTDKSDILKDLPDNKTWVLLNVGQSGFYRVNYDSHNWALLCDALMSKSSSIHVANRAQLIDDAFALARAGRRPYHLPIGLASYLKNEKEYAPWVSAGRGWEHLTAMLWGTKAYGNWSLFVMETCYNRYEEMALTIDPHKASTNAPHKASTNAPHKASTNAPHKASTNAPHKASTNHTSNYRQMRMLIYYWTCRMNQLDCVTSAQKSFNDWIEGKDSSVIDPDIRPVILCTGVRNAASVQVWNKVWDKFIMERSAVGKRALMRAMCCSNNGDILATLLNRTLYPSSGIRRQDAPYVFSSIARKDGGHQHALSFLKKRSQKIYEVYQDSPHLLGRMLQAVASRINRKEDLAKMLDAKKVWEGMQPVLEAHPAFQQALETANNNLKWTEKSYENVAKILAENRRDNSGKLEQQLEAYEM